MLNLAIACLVGLILGYLDIGGLGAKVKSYFAKK